MIPVTAYKAFTGELFGTAKECSEYETHCIDVAKVIDRLPKGDFEKDDDWFDGKTYFQLDKGVYLAVRDAFFMLVEKKYPRPEFRQQIGRSTWFVSPLELTQTFNSLNDSPIMLAWNMLASVDNEYRRWCNMTKAHHAPKNAKCVNP